MEKTVRYYEREDYGASLIIMERFGKIRMENLKNQSVIGRDDEINIDIELSSVWVSRKHGRFFCLNGKYYYEDLHSTNGTYINGMLFGKDSKLGCKSGQLRNGDIFKIDYGVKNEYHSEAVLMVFVTDFPNDVAWKKQELNDCIAELSIGRAKAGISIKNNMISHNHASFFKARRGWAIVDHDSTNGVFLNGIRITEPKYLYPFDVVRIADVFFFYDGKIIYYSADKEKSESGLVIEIHEKNVWQRFKKLTLLQDINLTIQNGEMVLVLGGSGAGKTTFMNAVMGYEKANGTIKHGNTDIYVDYEKIKYEIGFVPQQDLLRGSDTVYDTLSNAAKMKLPKQMSAEQREQRIKEVLELLGLINEKQSLVDKISGGQRKRLSIAVEYIADPMLFFLDEPDSGLDGPMSEELMKNLKTIADKGKIVMVITHGPDRIANLFDKVIVLAKSVKDKCGRLAYFGSVQGAYQFFETDSLEGVVKKINRKDEGGDGLSDFYIEKYKRMQR